MRHLSFEPKRVISLRDKWVPAKQENFDIQIDEGAEYLHLKVAKKNKNATHTFLSYGPPSSISFEVDPLLTYVACINGNILDSLDIQLVVTGYNQDKRIISEHIGLDISKVLPFSNPDITNGRVMLRISGSGEAIINDIQILCFKEPFEEIEHAIPKLNEDAEYLILTNVYPEKNNLYRNMFVHRRAELYEKNNIKCDVFRFSVREQTIGYYDFEDIFVLTGGPNELTRLLNKKKYKKILIHFVDKDMIGAIEKSIALTTPILVWIHGVETEKWYRRWFNFSRNSDDLGKALASIPANEDRMKFMKSIYESKTLNIKFIFVSLWFKEAVAECDTNAYVKTYSIIHNVVDDQLFNYIKKDKEQRKKILSIRPYASHKYANDLSVKAILELSKKDYFNELEFNIYGQGLLFDEILDPIKHFKNVHLHNHFLKQGEIAKLHKENGIFLCPTRLDSQGVSMCEAMSSGLIPVTNGVTAIPEFVDEDSGCLAGREDYHGLANAIEYLYFNPEEFERKSYNAAKRMREQCGINKVIEEELSEIKH